MKKQIYAVQELNILASDEKENWITYSTFAWIKSRNHLTDLTGCHLLLNPRVTQSIDSVP